MDLTVQEPHHTSNASIAEISAISRPYPTHLPIYMTWSC